MKKLLIIFVLLFSFVGLTTPNVAAASEWDMENVPVDKVFTINFSSEVDPKTITNENIIVKEIETNRILKDIDLDVSGDKKSVTVTNFDKYNYSRDYALIVSDKVVSSTGKALNKEVTMEFTTIPPKVTNEMVVHYVDVGQGDSTLLQLATGENVLIDGGPKGAGDDVVAYLKSLGITKLDYVIATHPDADHIGGLINVLNNFSVATFINSGKEHTTETYFELLNLVKTKNVNYIEPEPGTIYEYDVPIDSYFQTLFAFPDAAETNDASLVVKAGLGDVNFLFMADASTQIENNLVNYYDTIDADILKAGHHGSDTSSSLSFLRAVDPEITILSYGEDNSYGHPHSSVISNLRLAGSKVYSTADNGTIVVRTDGKTYTVSGVEYTGNGNSNEQEQTGDPSSGSYVIPDAPTTFSNCTAMRVYYPKGVKSYHPAYAKKHDRDGDGWACEP